MSNQPPKGPEQPRKGTGRLPALNTTPQALVPVAPESTVAEIIAQVQGAGSTEVELLVPDDVRALQSVAGCDALRQAAEKQGIHITLFTADEKTLTAARLARIEFMEVGGGVATPRAATPPRTLTALRPSTQRPTGEAPATARPAAPTPPPQRPGEQRPTAQQRPAEQRPAQPAQPARPTEQRPAQPSTAQQRPAPKTDFPTAAQNKPQLTPIPAARQQRRRVFGAAPGF